MLPWPQGCRFYKSSHNKSKRFKTLVPTTVYKIVVINFFGGCYEQMDGNSCLKMILVSLKDIFNFANLGSNFIFLLCHLNAALPVNEQNKRKRNTT